jgi:hypothetical protein
VDLRRETDIEQLRRVAIAQQIQIEQLLRVLGAKCDELAALKGSEAELQQTLSLVEDLTRQAQTVAAQIDKLPKTSGDGAPRRKDRTSFGPTEQSACLSSARLSSSMQPTRRARAAVASWRP